MLILSSDTTLDIPVLNSWGILEVLIIPFPHVHIDRVPFECLGLFNTLNIFWNKSGEKTEIPVTSVAPLRVALL